jgi:hypothetical protein
MPATNYIDAPSLAQFYGDCAADAGYCCAVAWAGGDCVHSMENDDDDGLEALRDVFRYNRKDWARYVSDASPALFRALCAKVVARRGDDSPAGWVAASAHVLCVAAAVAG